MNYLNINNCIIIGHLLFSHKPIIRRNNTLTTYYTCAIQSNYDGSHILFYTKIIVTSLACTSNTINAYIDHLTTEFSYPLTIYTIAFN